MGLPRAVLADLGVEAAPYRKPAKLTFSVIKQKDGSLVDRLELPVSSAPASDKRIPSTPAEWLDRMMDPTRNGLLFREPQLFAEWLDAVTEPQFMTALATVALDPQTYPKTLNRLADPATARNWSEIMGPEIFMRWVAAGMDPRIYQAVFQHMVNPKKYLRWATAQPGSLSGSGVAVQDTDPLGRKYRDHGEWMQIPVREGGDNPWLANSRAYRY